MPKQDFTRVVLITGASSGLGNAIALHLVKNNYIVYGTSRNPKEEILNGIHFLKLEVTNPESIQELVKKINAAEGRIDYLINNAGKGITGPMEEIPEVELKHNFEVNYFGPLNLIKAVLPIMRAQGSGMIINVTSIASFMGLPYRGAYSATKSALAITTESFRMELSEFGVKMTNIAPGDFATNIASGRYHAPLRDDSPYLTSYGKSLSLMNDHVNHGENPQLMADAVHKIMLEDNPNVNYKVGSMLQKISVILKGILPGKTYERLISKHYKL